MQSGRQIHAAVTSDSAGWTGAALYGEYDGNLIPAGHARRPRSIVGRLLTPLPASPSLVLERGAAVEVTIPDDLWLTSTTADSLAGGSNRALIGDEVVQFAEAERIGPGRWRLRGLLRGRGGTETAAAAGHQAGCCFVLLDDTLVPIDMGRVTPASRVQLAAIGLLDDEPVMAGLANAQGSIKPLAPVHMRQRRLADGGYAFNWTRRISGAWDWPDTPVHPTGSMPPLYQIGIGQVDAPVGGWLVEDVQLDLSADRLAQLHGQHAGKPLWLREVGCEASSNPVRLMIL